MQLPLMKRDKAAKKVLFRVLGRALKDKRSGKQRATAGQALQGQMLHAALKAGVEIRLQSPVKELIVDNGRVTGVVTADGARIDAKLGVLLNAGGFARNQRMLDQYMPGVRSEEHTSELQSLMRISYAVFCLKKKNTRSYKQS